MAKKWLNTAIVGTGRQYFDGHECVFKEGEPFSPIAFVDWDEKRATQAMETIRNHIKEIKEDWAENALQHMKVYTSFDKMLDELEGVVEFVDNVSHTGSHISLAIKALERNVNIQVEKPPALNWLQTKALVEAQKKSKAQYQLAEHVCFERTTLALRKLMDEQKIGDIEYLEVIFGHNGPYWPFVVNEETKLPFFIDPAFGGGGCLQDLGPHGISRGFWLVGEGAKAVRCHTKALERRRADRKLTGHLVDSPVDDYAVAEFDAVDGNGKEFKMKLTTSWCGQPPGDLMKIVGTKGQLGMGKKFLLGSKTPYVKGLKGFKKLVRPVKDNYPAWNAKIRETQMFGHAILNNEKTICNAEYAHRLQEIISLHYFSKMENREVTIEEMDAWGDKLLEQNGNDWEKASIVAAKEFAKAIDILN